jgi:ABC-type transport system substrate-binding protein
LIFWIEARGFRVSINFHALTFLDPVTQTPISCCFTGRKGQDPRHISTKYQHANGRILEMPAHRDGRQLESIYLSSAGFERVNRAVVLRLGSIVALTFVLATACSPAASPAGVAPRQSGAQLDIGMTSPIETFNPVTMIDFTSASFARFVWAGLLTINASGVPIPILARSVPSQSNGLISGDGRSITFVLRRGLRWSDGKPITAEDVKFGWQLAMQPRALLCAAACGVIKNVVVDSRTTVTFLLSKPFSPLFFELPPVVPRHTIWHGSWSSTMAYLYDPSTTFLGPSSVVNGPFKVASATPKSVTFVRNPFWSALQKPGYSRIVVHVLHNDSAMLAATKSGVIQLGQNYSPLNWNRQDFSPKTLAGLHMVILPMNGVEHLEPNEQGPYFNDVRVRQAFSLAVNREQMLKDVLQMPQSVASKLVAYSPESPGRFDGIAVRGAWDPIKDKFVTTPQLADARKLLDMAGWHVGPGGYRYKAGCPVKRQTHVDTLNIQGHKYPVNCVLDPQIVEPNDSIRGQDSLELINDWTAIGADITPHNDVTPNPWRGSMGWMLSTIPQHGSCPSWWVDACLFAQNPQYDPQLDYDLEFTSNHVARLKPKPQRSDINYAGIRDPRLDSIFAKGADTYDLATRAALYRSWQVKTVKQAYWIVLYDRPEILIYRGRIRNLNPSTYDLEWNPWQLGPGK